jgi:hypothetical protein
MGITEAENLTSYYIALFKITKKQSGPFSRVYNGVKRTVARQAIVTHSENTAAAPSPWSERNLHLKSAHWHH